MPHILTYITFALHGLLYYEHKRRGLEYLIVDLPRPILIPVTE